MDQPDLDIAIVISRGLPGPFQKHGSPGLDALSVRATAAFAQNYQTFIDLYEHDDDLTNVVYKICQRHPKFIAHYSHSFGAGHGLLNFAKLLKLQGRTIDFISTADPVEDVPFTNHHRTEPFPLPDGIGAVVAARTLYQPFFFFPWGRIVDHPNLVGEIIYPITSNVTHADIDAQEDWHTMTIDETRIALEEKLAE